MTIGEVGKKKWFRRIPLVLLVAAPLLTVAGLGPHALKAEHTAGHQGRSLRLRSVADETSPTRDEPRICDDGEPPSPTDPCIGAEGRLDYSESHGSDEFNPSAPADRRQRRAR